MRPLTSDLLLRAYASGVFPMARSRDENRLYWVDPEQRGILPLDGFHIPKSLRKTLRSGRFEVTCDTQFESVMRACGEATIERPETWINEKIISLFVELFELGLAHSVEVRQDGQLVGGLYGLALGAAFFGESMFSRRTDASKVALVHLVARLRRDGFRLLDTQFVTDHLKQFGAVEIPRAAYQERLADALDERAWFDRDGAISWEWALG
ncbi:Leucyl/phenylalanyl-tRNA--protein transferase [Paramagnetospirillum magnetotacticum MS-1]|uniref:Leucyl/phenylalanyl-tRNA--protein transferase n=1 Tax=Paramagnetospirillum magnetotacticum MS-1 TaxID=272627 RepID=A0A0C2YU32_PARME|nr:leucyl/phenylalanyl-tRNA--protein transferase [Paramagnetospirillum magnetotacticum]KIL98613.1 Leucyl/phenylalanyl-tRNA--protein transferase [Paramagnetospirillum magnetotacticum MS-1]